MNQSENETKCGPVTIALIKGLARIEKAENWCKGVEYQARGHVDKFCAFGAIRGKPGTPDYIVRLSNSEAHRQACVQLRLAGTRHKASGMSVVNFNDHYQTTHDQIKEVFRQAIKNAVEKGI